MTTARSSLRQLPSVARVLDWPAVADLAAHYGRDLVVEAVQATLQAARDALRAGSDTLRAGSDPGVSPAAIVDGIADRLADWLAPTLYPVINATGVIIHTNLGRAPLSRDALAAVQAVGSGYSTLEYDVDAGARGSRALHAAQLLTRLTGAADATVVNNAAAAVLLMLTALCRGREVIISRGQLIEIGGGFRVPDVMAQSGARLVEVGTTNRTRLSDYEGAISAETAAILVAHHSNFKIVGFTEEPALAELAELARARGVLLLFDQGSGALLDTAAFGLEPEPLVPAALADGCDMVVFSGDKLLGGPQAGVLCGRADLVATVKRHPLARAVRADKLCLAALAATLASYARGRAPAEIPVWQMMARGVEEVADSAESWAATLRDHGLPARTQDGFSTVGGGTLPGQQLPTRLLALDVPAPDAYARRLRTGTDHGRGRGISRVIGRIQQDTFLVDPRTVLPEQAEPLLAALIAAAEPESP